MNTVFSTEIYAVRLRPDAKLPERMTGGSAACDLCAALGARTDGSDMGFGDELVNIFFINSLVGADGLVIRSVGPFVGAVGHGAFVPG